MKLDRFEDLEVWQEAKRLANLVYAVTAKPSFARDFALKDQMRRAAVSVLSNIAEGFESRTQAMFIEFLGRAKGSSGELRAQIYLTRDQEYVTAEEFRAVYAGAESCSKQLGGLIKYLESTPESHFAKRTGIRTSEG